MSFQELSSRGRGGKDTLVTKESIKVSNLHAQKRQKNIHAQENSMIGRIMERKSESGFISNYAMNHVSYFRSN